MEIHVVAPGETPVSIANQYGVSLSRLLSDNGLNPNSALAVGQALVIVFPSQIHIVGAGETLYNIATSYGVSVNQLLRNNFGVTLSTPLAQGREIVIAYSEQKLGTFETNSYAYPYVSSDLIRTQLPYLTYFTPFTYGITPTGGLVDLNDEELLNLANEYGNRPLMHLSSLTEQGNFSNELAHLVLTDATIQSNLIDAILQNVGTKGYVGVDVDFEFIYPEDSYDYAAFLQNLRLRLEPAGLELFSAVAPKTSDTQRGILYEGHNYALIGAAVNKVLLMTYEWGYTYGPPMAVAPLNLVRGVLEYAVTRISPDKCYMGFPTYGYDWTLPYVSGSGVAAPSISPVYATELAVRYGAEIKYDETAQSPWFNYADENGALHEVWFEDARSVRAKLALANEFSLLGIGYWNSMREFPQNWVVLNALYNIVDR